MDNMYHRIRSIDTETNRWIIPVGAVVLGLVVIGLATMLVAPMFRRDTMRELESQGRGLKKRSAKRASAAVKQFKEAVADAAETVQDQADKVKKTARKKI